MSFSVVYLVLLTIMRSLAFEDSSTMYAQVENVQRIETFSKHLFQDCMIIETLITIVYHFLPDIGFLLMLPSLTTALKYVLICVLDIYHVVTLSKITAHVPFSIIIRCFSHHICSQNQVYWPIEEQQCQVCCHMVLKILLKFF